MTKSVVSLRLADFQDRFNNRSTAALRLHVQTSNCSKSKGALHAGESRCNVDQHELSLPAKARSWFRGHHVSEHGRCLGLRVHFSLAQSTELEALTSGAAGILDRHFRHVSSSILFLKSSKHLLANRWHLQHSHQALKNRTSLCQGRSSHLDWCLVT